MIFSCPPNTQPALWQAMQHCVPVDNWRGAINSNGMLIASSILSKTEKDNDRLIATREKNKKQLIHHITVKMENVSRMLFQLLLKLNWYEISIILFNSLIFFYFTLVE